MNIKAMQIIQKNILWITLLFTLAACFYVAQQDGADQHEDGIVLARTEAEQINYAKTNKVFKQQPYVLPQLLRTQLTNEPKNIFTIFIPQAELNQKNSEAPVEAALANPFIFAGKLVDNGKIIVFLMDAQTNYSVVTGDILAEVWQVRSIAPPMMTIRYLPLKIDMQLQIGALS